MSRVRGTKPPDPRMLRPDALEQLSRAALRALAKRPEDRWESAAALLAAIRVPGA